MKLVAIIGLMSFAASLLQAQDFDPLDERQQAVDQVIEFLSEQLESETLDFTTLLQELNYYYEHPINLNKTSVEELTSLGFITQLQAYDIIDHRQRTGRIMSPLELQGVESLDQQTLSSLLPFVRVGGSLDNKRLTWEGVKQESTHETFIRYQRVIEPMAGYAPITEAELEASPNSRYVGDPSRVYARYRYRYLKNISAGITMDKDAGEAFFGSTQPRGFDFYSAHLYVGERGVLKQAIIGDYQAQFGQGLTFWSGLAFNKSVDIASIKRNARGITPYVSADENNFLRGAATALKFGTIEFTSFASYKGVDANIISLDTQGLDIQVSEFSSFQSSGVHGTPSQIEDRDALQEFNGGGHLRYIGDRFQVGATAVYTSYDATPVPSAQLYKSFEPSGNTFVLSGMDYQFLFRNVMVFGENAFRSDGGSAFLNGMIWSLDPAFNLSILHRNYAANYVAPRSNAISESSRNSNEEGLLLGSAASFGRRWKLSGYFDAFYFPWLRYQTDQPSEGLEYLLQLDYRPNKRSQAYVRYRSETKDVNTNDQLQPTAYVSALAREWLRFHFQYQLSKTISVRSRMEWTRVLVGNVEEQGFMIYQDLIYKPEWPRRYQVKLRYALFDTDGFDSRIYAYEHDLLYSFSIPAYFYRGSRAYIMLNYDLTRWSDLSMRLAQTFYSNRDQVGSGLNEIEGSTRTDIRVQYRVKF